MSGISIISCTAGFMVKSDDEDAVCCCPQDEDGGGISIYLPDKAALLALAAAVSEALAAS